MRRANAQRADLEAQVLQDVGDIVSATDDRFTIACDGATFTARRAVSCLVEPKVGDHVFFAGRSSGDLYVLAVLERTEEGTEVVMRVAGDLTLKVDHGRFAVAASEGVDIVSKEEIALTSKSVEVRATRAQMFVRRLEVVGDALFGDVRSVKTMVGKLERVAEHAIERITRSYRFIEEAEHVRAGSFEVVANEAMRLKGENSFVQADNLVKIDGDQIHLG